MAPIKGTDYDPKLIEPGSNEGHTPDWAKKALEEIHALPETNDYDGADEKPKKDLDGDELDKQESGVDTDSGQDAAETPKEESSEAIDNDDPEKDGGLYSGSGDTGSGSGKKSFGEKLSVAAKSARGSMTSKKGLIAAGIAAPIVGIVLFVLVALPTFIMQNLRDLILNGPSRIQNRQSLTYRRSKITRVKDLFTLNGRRGGKLMSEMQLRGYDFRYEADGTTLREIRTPRGKIVGAGDLSGLGTELNNYMESRHPFRTSGWKTRRMESLYAINKVPRAGPNVPKSQADLDNPEVAARKALAEDALRGEDVEESSITDRAPDGESDEARADREAREVDAREAAESNGAYDEALDEALEGRDLSKSTSEATRSATTIGAELSEDGIRIAEEAAAKGGIGGKALAFARSLTISGTLDRVCTIHNRINMGILAARLAKSAVLLRYAASYVTASDSARMGIAAAALTNVIMMNITSRDSTGGHIGKSEGFKYLLNGKFNRNNNEQGRNAVAVDGKPTGWLAGLRNNTRVPGCSFWQNPLVQIGEGILQVAVSIFSGGSGGAAAQTAVTTTKVAIVNIFRSVLISVLKSVAFEITFQGVMSYVQLYVEKSMHFPFTTQEKGQELGSILAAGGGVANRQKFLLNGFVPATTTEYAAAERTYIAETKAEFSKLSLKERLFSMNNDYSLGRQLANRTIMSTPIGMDGVAALPGNFMNILSSSLNIGNGANTVASGFFGKAYAQSQTGNVDVGFDEYVTEGDNPGISLATDPAGNLQTFMRDDIAAVDPDANKTFMVTNGYIPVDGDTPQGDFAEHIKNCVETTDQLTTIETKPQNDPKYDCLATQPTTVQFKAYMAFQGNVEDPLDAELFPEEIIPADAAPTAGAGTTGQVIANFTGPIIPCSGQARTIQRIGDRASWEGITPTGTIGTNSAGQPMNVYIRDACAGQTNVRTVVIGASIHGTENGGQVIAQELLFNKTLPPDVRIIAIPEINKSGVDLLSPRPRLNMNSVNLNRNFAYQWDQAAPSSIDPPTTYKGTGPASEPETQAIQNFLTDLGKTNLVISYHDNINWVAPSGPNSSVSRPMAQRYATLANHPFLHNNRGFGFFEAWYASATGTPALLVELSTDSSQSYLNRHADAVVGILQEGVVP